jgi:hypothetical protein
MPNECPSISMQQHIELGAAQPHKCRDTRAASLSQFVCLSLLACLLVFSAVPTQAQQSAKVQDKIEDQSSGFLVDYSKLQPDAKNGDLLVYWKSPDVLKDFHKIMLDPIVVYLLPEAQQRGIDPADLAMLTQYFTQAITNELAKSGGYDVVTEPGPGVVVLRVAITNVQPNAGKKNAAVKGAAMAASTAVAPGASMAVPRLSVGKVSIEGEIDDSVSGERLVAFMTSKSGKRYFSGLNAYKQWGDIQAAFRAWAKNFRERLDQATRS